MTSHDITTCADVERCVAAEWPVEAASDAVARFLAECSGSGSGGGEGRVNAHVSQLLLLVSGVLRSAWPLLAHHVSHVGADVDLCYARPAAGVGG